MRLFASLFIALSFACSVQAALSDNELLQYWSEVISKSNINDIISVFQAGPKKEWPAIYSTNFDSTEKEPQEYQQVEFRKLCGLLAHGLERHETQLRGRPLPEFCESVQSLLSMRQHIAHNPSYLNLVLIDTINRIVYVNLSERLAHVENLSPCLLTLANSLGEFRTNLIQLLTISKEELNYIMVDEAVYSSASNAKRLSMLWSAVQPGTRIMFPKNPLNLGTYQLMEKQDIPVLLTRLVLSDLYIHSLLPALILYRQNAELYSPIDSYQQIKAILGRETKVKESLGAETFGVSRAASAVNYLLQDIQSGKTRKQLLFSVTEFLGKGRQ